MTSECKPNIRGTGTDAAAAETSLEYFTQNSFAPETSYWTKQFHGMQSCE